MAFVRDYEWPIILSKPQQQIAEVTPLTHPASTQGLFVLREAIANYDTHHLWEPCYFPLLINGSNTN